MKHRQEETPTPFEICCGVYQPQINPVTEARQRRYRKPCSAKWHRVETVPLQGPNNPPEQWGCHGTEVKREPWLWLLKMYCTTGIWLKPGCMEDLSETETRSSLNMKCRSCWCLVWEEHKCSGQIRLFFGTTLPEINMLQDNWMIWQEELTRDPSYLEFNCLQPWNLIQTHNSNSQWKLLS